MAFKTVPIKLPGQTYRSRSRPLSAQTTLNLYPEFNPTGKSQEALQNWYGSIRRVTSAGGADRGSHDFNGTLYKISGTTLYSVDSNYVETVIGTIPGTQRCILNDDGSNLVIATGGTPYLFNGLTLSAITDPDLENPNSVAVLNNQFIFDGNGSRWVVATAGIPSDIPDINYASAESAGDDLVRVFVFNQTVYLLGTKTIEPWFNSGSGSPPFSRIDGGIIEQLGLYSLHSVAATKQYFYMVGSDKHVYRITAYQPENITPPGIYNEFSKLELSDAIGTIVPIESQDFYVLSLPTSNKTWVFSEQLNVWFELAHGANKDRHIINFYHFIYGKHLITDYRNGNILELDSETYTDDGDTQIRQRDSAPITGIELKMPGQRLEMAGLELIIETGVGLPSGQGSNPLLKIGTSIDGGRTFDFSGNPYISAGVSGNYILRVRLDKILTFYELMVRIIVSDPVFVSVHSASIDIDLAGW